MGAFIKGIPWLVAACVLQEPISFAYTSCNRLPQNTRQFQPALVQRTGGPFEQCSNVSTSLS
jgi:hypothetical protein